MHGSVVYLAHSQGRRRWRSLVLIALLAGLVGGLAMSLVAGSRRSSSVVDRFVSAATKYDVMAFSPALTGEDRAALLQLPGVTRADPSAFVAFVATAPDGTRTGVNANMFDFAAVDPTNRVLEGQIPDGSDPTQILVSATFAQQFGVGVGEGVELQTYGVEQYDAVGAGEYSQPTGPTYPFHVAAIVRLPPEIASDKTSSPGQTRYDNTYVIVPDTWYWAHRTEFLDFGAGYYLQIDEATTTVDDVQASVTAMVPEGEELYFGPAESSVRRASLASPVDLETSALLALGIGIGLSGAAAVALLLRAEQRDHDRDAPTLRALGCTRSEIGLVAAARAAPVAVAGAAMAAAVAVLLSGRYPIGIGREVELQPGIDVNLAVVGLGTVLVTLVVVGSALALGRPPLERPRAALTPDALSRWLARAGAPINSVLGTHLAFTGREGRSSAARSAIVGGAAALGIVTATAVFVGGVDRLYSEPARHGWPWDAVVGNTNFALAGDTYRRLQTDPRVEGLTTALTGSVVIDGTSAFLVVIDPSGTAPPAVAAGRLPTTGSEIALGPALRADLDVDVGDTVTLSIADGDLQPDEREPQDLTLTVVGEAALPVFGDGDMGEDAVITFDGLTAAGGQIEPQIAMLRLRSHDRSDLTALDRDLTEEIYTDLVPARIVTLHGVRGLPLLGLLLAGTMGTIVLAFTLVTGARARLRDLAVLRVLGMEARRLHGVLAWQGISLAGAMLAIGLPAGLAAGVAWWRTVADGLGVSAAAVVTPRLWLLVPLTGLVAVAVSIYPAWRARRLTGAALLRTE